MFSSKKKIKDKDMKILIEAYVNFKKAEKIFKALKEDITKDLDVGKYESKFGTVTVSEYIRTHLDLERLFKSNPRLKRENYEIEKIVTNVGIHNLNS